MKISPLLLCIVAHLLPISIDICIAFLCLQLWFNLYFLKFCLALTMFLSYPEAQYARTWWPYVSFSAPCCSSSMFLQLAIVLYKAETHKIVKVKEKEKFWKLDTSPQGRGRGGMYSEKFVFSALLIIT